MFEKLAKWFGLDKPTNLLEDFLRSVQHRADTNSCETFATFTPQGFNLVMELLINRAEYSLSMFIEKRELFLDYLKLMMLEAKLKQFALHGGKATIATFGGEKDKELLKLQEQYPNCFEYLALKCSNAPEVNNFVIVDNKSYLLEDPLFRRNSIGDNLKAEVNFFNFSRSSLLLEKFNSYTRVGKSE